MFNKVYDYNDYVHNEPKVGIELSESLVFTRVINLMYCFNTFCSTNGSLTNTIVYDCLSTHDHSDITYDMPLYTKG